MRTHWNATLSLVVDSNGFPAVLTLKYDVAVGYTSGEGWGCARPLRHLPSRSERSSKSLSRNTFLCVHKRLAHCAMVA